MDPENLYARLPLFAQKMMVNLQGRRIAQRRYDYAFARILADAERTGALQGMALRDFQAQQITRHFHHAAQSGLWAARFHSYGVAIKSGDPFTELAKLPVITKSEIIDHTAGLVPQPFKRGRLIPCHTSGSTGSGLKFKVTPEAEKKQYAVWWRYRSWHGIDLDTWCAYFGGRSIVPLRQKKPPYWRVNRPGKQILFSAYHLNADTAADYISALHEHAPAWIHGYPSMLAVLAGFIRDHRLPRVNSLRMITTGAESLLPHQRALLESVFNVPVFDHYGQAEAVANISQCENSTYHVDEDFSYVEFLPVETEPGLFRVVGTNWTNPAFPLFRYDTGDHVRLADVTCSCHRPGRIVTCIDGRQEDYVTLPNGVKLGRLDHIFKDMTQIREAQIHQPDTDRVILRVVKAAGYSDSTEKELLRQARKRLGEEINIGIEYRSVLP
ncbi:MAG: hypothetical protein ABIK28_15975, partial [Planctomycetota bacterium]